MFFKERTVILSTQILSMKTRNILIVLGLIFLLAGCARAVTPAEAASGSYHHCRPV